MIIVTGSSGFIGSNLVRELCHQGYSVLGVDYVLDRSYCSKCYGFRHTPADMFYSHMEQYITEPIEIIFHEGAISSTTETDTKKLFEYNIQPTMDLMYFARDRGIPLQYASSASVYGNPTREQWHNPHKSPNPLNEYARTKKFADYLAEWIIQSRRPPKLFQGMRYFNVYGPNEDHKGDQASPYHKFNVQLKESGRIRLFEGSRDFYRDFVSVEEVIRLKLLAWRTQGSGVFDVGSGSPKSFYDVALEVCSAQGISDPDSVIDWVSMPQELQSHYQKYSWADMSWAE